jgi:hypothetical protein
MRTSNARDFLDFFRRRYPAVHLHVTATVPREVLDRIEHGVRTEWIPVELDGQFVDAILDFMGPDALKTATREFLAQSLVQSAMMRSMFEGVLRAFGVSVGSFLKVMSGGMRQSYQDAFTVTVERGEGSGLVVFDDIAPEVLQFRAYAIIWEGLFLGLYDLAHKKPQLDFKLLRGARRMEASFRW